MNLADKTVLIVDDTEFHRILMSDMLTDLGVKNIITAEDGLAGVRSARFYKPDLILLDLEMPNINGYEACEKIRLFADKIVMPIIVITGKEKGEALEKVFELGANDYFEKPFNADEVSNRVSFYLEYCDMLQNLSRLEQYIKSDLDIAKSIQGNTIPCPDKAHEELRSSGLDMYSYYQAVSGLGGDSWLVKTLESGDPVFFLCDVSGHGINAAINNSFVVSTIHSVFESYAQKTASECDPTDIMERLNAILSQHMQIGTFCAGACMVYDCTQGIIKYAGSALPDIVRADMNAGTSETFPCKGVPMGLLPENLKPTSGEIKIEDHHMLLCMSDGLVENVCIPNAEKLEQGSDLLPGERLLSKSIRQYADKIKTPAAATAQGCIEDIITSFTKYQPCMEHEQEGDDVTLLAIRKTSKAA